MMNRKTVSLLIVIVIAVAIIAVIISEASVKKLAFDASGGADPGLTRLDPAIHYPLTTKEVGFYNRVDTEVVDLKVIPSLTDPFVCPDNWIPNPFMTMLGAWPFYKTQSAVSIARTKREPYLDKLNVHPSGIDSYGGVFGYDLSYTVSLVRPRGEVRGGEYRAKLIKKVEKIRRPVSGYYINTPWNVPDDNETFRFDEQTIIGVLEPGRDITPIPNKEYVLCTSPSSSKTN